MTETKASLRQRTNDYADEWAGTINPIKASRDSALHGPPIEFAIEALERIAQFGSSEGDTKVDPPRFKIAREALAEIRKARGDV